MEKIYRKDVRNMNIDNYDLILDSEHHEHELIKDEHGTIRWLENPVIRGMVDAIGLNEVVEGLYANGFNKNSELYRAIYRGLGYSLSGYWEVFYWKANNDNADTYVYKELK